jgi:hypothetical protein
MLVKCISICDCPNCLSLGKIYTVVNETEDEYTIVCNHNEEWTFNKKYFEPVKELVNA